MTNGEVADRLHRLADLLQQQEGNPFRVGAYRRAADTVAGLDRPLQEILAAEGEEGLQELPDIGSGIAGAIGEMVRTGHWSQLERLQGELEAPDLFQVLPGVGPELSERIHDALHVDTLEALEIAAHDGRLEQVEGIGPRRAAAIRAELADLLVRRGGRRRRAGTADEPRVETLLDVDREYRDRAATGKLRRIAPRRFNPEGEAWLPILHTERDGWHFTALYSNSPRAHGLGRTHDWVILYFYDQDHHEGQRTVVTETRGPLEGKRVVRGREPECREHYGGD